MMIYSRDKNDVDRIFNELWRKHEPYIRKLCEYKLQSQPQYVDDCVQEVFKALFCKLRDGEAIERPKAWLTTVANNKINDVYKTSAKNVKYTVPLNEDRIKNVPADCYFCEEQPFTQEQILSAKDEVISCLNEKERRLFEDRYVKKYKISKMAKLYGTTQNNIKQQLFRMRKKTEKLIKEHIENAQNN